MRVTRTFRYKFVHATVLFSCVVVVVTLLILLQARLVGALLVGLAFLIPGRVQGYFWRSFFRGRRALGAGHFEAAIEHFESFLDQLKRRPWLKSLVWLAGAIYTRDIEVMALNNLGTAQLQLGNWASAVEYLECARGKDPESPLPYFNLAVLAQAGGEEEEARRLLRRATELGYRRTSVDRLIHTAGAVLARVEGR